MDYAHVMTSTTSLSDTGSTRDRSSDTGAGRAEMATGMSGGGFPPRSDAKAGTDAGTSTTSTTSTTGTGASSSSGPSLSAAVQGVFAPHDNGPEGMHVPNPVPSQKTWTWFEAQALSNSTSRTNLTPSSSYYYYYSS